MKLTTLAAGIVSAMIIAAPGVAEPLTTVEKPDLSDLNLGDLGVEKTTTTNVDRTYKSETYSAEVGKVGDHGVSVYGKSESQQDRFVRVGWNQRRLLKSAPGPFRQPSRYPGKPARLVRDLAPARTKWDSGHWPAPVPRYRFYPRMPASVTAITSSSSTIRYAGNVEAAGNPGAHHATLTEGIKS